MSKNTGTSELINYFDLLSAGAVSIAGTIYANDGVQLSQVGTALPTNLKNVSGSGIVSFGSNFLGFNGSNNLYFSGDNKGYCEFAFNNAGGGRTYTFPSSSGTIALVGGSGVGTVTSVAALTLGTSGTDLSSTVANSTTTPVITLNVPTASATNRGALSAADWTTFNNKQNALTNPVTGTGTINYLPKFTGSTSIGNSNVINDASGNLGLGVTPSAWSTSFGIKVIDTGTKGSFYSSDNDANVSFNQFFDGTNPVYKTSGTASRFALTGNEFQWRQAASGTAGNTISFTQAMTLNSVGNLLIGTNTNTTGFSRLVLNGGSGSESGIQVNYNASTFGGFAITTLQSAGGGMSVYTYTGNVGSESYAERIRVFSDGNTFIGSSPSNAGFKLDVNGTGRFTQNVTIGAATAATNVKLIFNGVASKAAGIEFHQSGTPQWYIGNGIASEDNNFELYNSNGTMAMKIIKSTNVINFIGAATFSSSVTARNGSSGTAFITTNAVDADFIIETVSGGTTKLGTTGNKLAINSSGGNVLIGTTTDFGNKLTVNGNAFTIGSQGATQFITSSGTASISTFSSGFTTFYTVQSNQNAIYLVTLQLNGYSNYTAYATICQNDNSLVIMNQVNNVAYIQVSGLNIQGSQNSGVTQSMPWRIIKIG